MSFLNVTVTGFRTVRLNTYSEQHRVFFHKFKPLADVFQKFIFFKNNMVRRSDHYIGFGIDSTDVMRSEGYTGSSIPALRFKQNLFGT